MTQQSPFSLLHYGDVALDFARQQRDRLYADYQFWRDQVERIERAQTTDLRAARDEWLKGVKP